MKLEVSCYGQGYKPISLHSVHEDFEFRISPTPSQWDWLPTFARMFETNENISLALIWGAYPTTNRYFS